MTPSVQIAGGRRVRHWTRESIIEKIAEWADRHGEPPASADWNPSLARWRAQEWRIDRYRDGVWPSTNAVKRHFGGSFDAAIRAAGFAPATPGPRRAPGSARPAVQPRERPERERVPVVATVRPASPRPAGGATAPPPGPAALADAIRRLAAARARGDRAGTARALAEVAAVAEAWRDRL